MIFRFLPEALIEFDEAIKRYEQQREGLGRRFAAEVQAAIQQAVAFPYASGKLSENVRCRQTNGFPYGILYTVREKENEILIIAIMHLHREPGYWKGRI